MKMTPRTEMPLGVAADQFQNVMITLPASGPRRADAADQRHHHGLGRDLEAEQMRRHEAAQQRVDQAAEGSDLRGHHVGQLVPERL